MKNEEFTKNETKKQNKPVYFFLPSTNNLSKVTNK